MHEFTRLLLNYAEKEYATFSKKLIPDTQKEIIGVRVPTIKKLAREHKNNLLLINDFISSSHVFYEEQLLHGLLLTYSTQNNDILLKNTDNFVCQIDNWAVCDSTVASLKQFKKNQENVIPFIEKWLTANNPYTVRFAIVSLMNYFLTDKYIDYVLQKVSIIKSEHYYVNMAISWLLSVALINFYHKTYNLLINSKLSLFIKRKTIQKAIESYRITDEKKLELKNLRKNIKELL